MSPPCSLVSDDGIWIDHPCKHHVLAGEGPRSLWAANDAFLFFATLMVVQVLLGIATLLWAVPISLGALHQLTAFLLLTAGLWSLHSVRIKR